MTKRVVVVKLGGRALEPDGEAAALEPDGEAAAPGAALRPSGSAAPDPSGVAALAAEVASFTCP